MKLRIGDLVTFREEDSRKTRRGFVTALTAVFLLNRDVEVTIKKDDLRSLVDRKSIVGVVPREKVRQYWKHL